MLVGAAAIQLQQYRCPEGWTHRHNLTWAAAAAARLAAVSLRDLGGGRRVCK